VAAAGGSEVHDGGLEPDAIVALAVVADFDLGAGGRRPVSLVGDLSGEHRDVNNEQR
jgi:hypothetical protein